MKKLVILFLLAAQAVSAQSFNPILNAPVKSAQLGDLKGRIVLIDFWATWCGSCIDAMPHLQALQAKYKGQLQVIAVNDETVKRTAQYLRSRPSNLWFAVDTSHALGNAYPHQLIPHDILIGADGQLIAATDPEAVTNEVIDSLLHHRSVHLPAKSDLMLSSEDLVKQLFPAADTVQYRLRMQGAVKGVSGMSSFWKDNAAFNGRRLTAVNISLSTLYMIANNNFPYSRTKDSTGLAKKMPVYCLDLIVKTQAELLPALRRELAARFDIQAKVTNVEKEVQILTVTDPAKFQAIPRNTSGKRIYTAGHGYIDQTDITMGDFAQYLEDYGTGKITLDRTRNTEKLDIKFNFQPENPQSLRDVLAGMGLELSKEKQEVPLLVLYKSGQ